MLCADVVVTPIHRRRTDWLASFHSGCKPFSECEADGRAQGALSYLLFPTSRAITVLFHVGEEARRRIMKLLALNQSHRTRTHCWFCPCAGARKTSEEKLSLVCTTCSHSQPIFKLQIQIRVAQKRTELMPTTGSYLSTRFVARPLTDDSLTCKLIFGNEGAKKQYSCDIGNCHPFMASLSPADV